MSKDNWHKYSALNGHIYKKSKDCFASEFGPSKTNPNINVFKVIGVKCLRCGHTLTECKEPNDIVNCKECGLRVWLSECGDFLWGKESDERIAYFKEVNSRIERENQERADVQEEARSLFAKLTREKAEYISKYNYMIRTNN